MPFISFEEALRNWWLEDCGPGAVGNGPNCAYKLPGQIARSIVRDGVLEARARLSANNHLQYGYVRGIIDRGEYHSLHDRLSGNPMARLDDAHAA